jgi:hypothetical protein
VVKQKEFEVDPAHRISIDLTRELHPLVRKTRAVLNGKSTPSGKDLPIDVHIGKSSRERALRLLSTMLYAFEERGFRIEACSGTNNGSFVIINDEPLQFSLNEETRKPAGRLAADSEHNSVAERVPETRLVFRIHDYWAQGYRKTWADGARRSLEEQLNDMMPALVELSAVIRKERLERERRHEEFRQRDLERARRQRMESDLKNWRIAVDLRALVAQVSSQASDEQNSTPEVTRWI